METAFYIKAVLAVIQWFAFGLQIGFGEAKENYEHMLDFTDDATSRKFLNEKIDNAHITQSVCLAVVISITIIIFLL